MSSNKGGVEGQGQPGNGDAQQGTPDTFAIYVDGEQYVVPKDPQTASQLLTLVGLNPAEYYLKEIHGRASESYKDRAAEPIHLHENARFCSVFMGATTVSDGGSRKGASLFAEQLRQLGIEVTELSGGHLTFCYEVEDGKFKGKVVTHGVVVPQDFPFSPPGGLHVSPPIHPNQSGGAHPRGGIHHSNSHGWTLPGTWQYWSRPFKGWSSTGRKTAATYLAFVRGLWSTQ